MNKIYKDVTECRICFSGNLVHAFNIADQYLSPTFVESNDDNPLSSIKVPHTLILCDDCGLLQLKETVDPDLLYRSYFYRSNTNEMMKHDLKLVVDDVCREIELDAGDVVVDIGANDCTMLHFYENNLCRIGVEPAQNIDWTNNDSNVIVVNDYFSYETINSILGGRKVKAYTSCAMFYDLDDPNSFVSAIKKTLAPEGVYCIQLSYLVLMLDNMNFYDICNEHLEYYSLQTLNTLMKRHNLEIYDAETNRVNGGSVKVMITHIERNIEPTVRFVDLLEKELSYDLNNLVTYSDFYDRMNSLKSKVQTYILNEKNKDNNVIGLGASTKGNMLLQFFEIDKSIMPYISEKNPNKVGLKTLGTDIELISETAARELKPSCMLVLPWYFKDEIIKRETEYIKSGGSLLFPMPYPHLITFEGEIKL